MTWSRRALSASTLFAIFPTLALLPPAAGQAPATGGPSMGASGGAAPGSSPPGANAPAPGVAGGVATAPPNRPTGGTTGPVTGGASGAVRGERNDYAACLSASQFTDLFGLLPAARDAQKDVRDFHSLDIERRQIETALAAKNLLFNVLNALAQLVRATGGR